ncbi:Hydroxymethylpyrimidine pyrophosphatase [Natronoarchaeum philippinense]|uniref:Hydroxymethylpyrimidine pyrophosphatase n=1 Tax=Natronoarchaeum philippinense TaxID=558529 RepID=A0A285P540_NATPI|nr:HAD family hydrolase [Natronoarchaeum philippinense]SNZ16830.1 Hydroxymethylpyrimidine pyrophosphatase [Natronoarchaeum philippinense]
MQVYHQLYELYDSVDTETLRARQDLVNMFPPLDSQVSLQQWESVRDDLDQQKTQIRRSFPNGDEYAEIAAHATETQAFTALDLYNKYERPINALVLDVDETLRSASTTDNEIPRDALYFLTELHERGVPIVICTGQTLENVKGFMIQGLGSEIVHSGNLSIVYEAGTGVFTPEHGADTKRLLYESLDDEIVDIFDAVRSRVLSDAPEKLRRNCHLQGNEFNITVKPNFKIGSERAREIIDAGLVHQIELLGDAVATQLGYPSDDGRQWTKAFYADADPEIDGVLTDREETATCALEDVPDDVTSLLERIDVAYYEADAAEIGSLELNKVAGVEAAFDVLGIDDPFAVAMGDSKSDLRVMRWLTESEAGICAAPEHASTDVLEFVRETDDLVFDEGNSSEMLRAIYALNELAATYQT